MPLVTTAAMSMLRVNFRKVLLVTTAAIRKKHVQNRKVLLITTAALVSMHAILFTVSSILSFWTYFDFKKCTTLHLTSFEQYFSANVGHDSWYENKCS